MIKILLVLSLSFATAAIAGTGVVTDGKSLLDGLTLYEKSQSGSTVTCEEAAIAVAAASYAQGFAAGCVVWQTKLGSKTPFQLPHRLTPLQFATVVQKYLREHPNRLSERAENLLFDATVAAFPRK